ncbi:hypothetical protein EDD17DRAFT_1584542 [Pisolithus thermaeus]|nr:hypothetical protein EV401DRAFT_1970351 [Pisolithus croceorrhizus]KAI6161762.1 hypothetical protein EDD17DRAFT_1584542 [Pisolithus thermaeus]
MASGGHLVLGKLWVCYRAWARISAQLARDKLSKRHVDRCYVIAEWILVGPNSQLGVLLYGSCRSSIYPASMGY